MGGREEGRWVGWWKGGWRSRYEFPEKKLGSRMVGPKKQMPRKKMRAVGKKKVTRNVLRKNY
jgi:hypothetical protein